MSIPSKWNMEKMIGRWLIFRESDGVFVCEIQGEANAKRICLTHNSHEGLLEACKKTIEFLELIDFWKRNSKDASIVALRDGIEQAITQAEAE